MSAVRVVKFGGQALANSETVARIGGALRSLGGPLVVVHGGGRAVDDLQRRLGIPIEKVDGLRRTGQEALGAALMVLCGLANKQFVAGLQKVDVRAVGLSGIDAGIFRVRPMVHPRVDLGFVGEIERVDSRLLDSLLAAGFVPVLAPLSLGQAGQIYNVNADQAAGELAVAMGAESLDLVSDVPGVEVDGATLAEVSGPQVEVLQREGAIRGGMVPKVRAGLRAASRGVRRVRIVDVAGLDTAAGTHLVADRTNEEAR